MTQDKRHRVEAALYSKSYEVHDKLEALGRNYNEFYDDILRNAIIIWDIDADETWEGRFHASSAQMMRWTGLQKSSFYIKLQKLKEAGLIREEEGGVWVVTD